MGIYAPAIGPRGRPGTVPVRYWRLVAGRRRCLARRCGRVIVRARDSAPRSPYRKSGAAAAALLAHPGDAIRRVTMAHWSIWLSKRRESDTMEAGDRGSLGIRAPGRGEPDCHDERLRGYAEAGPGFQGRHPQGSRASDAH